MDQLNNNEICLPLPPYRGVISYGGDPAVVATRAEIERIQAELVSVGNLLSGQLGSADFLLDPFRRISLATELSPIEERIRYLLQALDSAANQYFDGEALIAKELTDIGIASAPFLASILIAAANYFGLLREHPVRVIQLDRFSRLPPVGLLGLGERLDQITGDGHIVIERYGNRFVAYLPGTQTWNPLGSTNPIDVTSNLQAMRGPGFAASERGVKLALTAAGAVATSQILLVGHSQGGMIAANIAITDSRVKGLVTFGAPISQVAERIKIPTVAIQHNNDVVPKLGLKANPLASNMVTVERVMPITNESLALLQAHDVSNYTKTAELADQSKEFGLKRVREQVLPDIGVVIGETTVYKLERQR